MRLVDRLRGHATLLALATMIVSPAFARADSADAEVLFRQGRTLIKNGKLAEGCDKLAASERAESSVGTLLNLGDCKEKLGKLASAWAAFRKAAAMAQRATNDDKRQIEAARRADKLEPRLSNIVIVVARPIEGLVVRRDLEPIESAAWSTGLPVDPGTYTIAADAPGYKPWSTSVTVVVGAKREVVTVPALQPAPELAKPPAIREIEQPVVTGTERIDSRPRGTWTTTRQVGVVAGVLGLAAAGTGVYFGFHARDLDQKANERCPQKMCGDPEGLSLNAQAKTAANRANVLYVVGAGAAVTGIVLWLVGAPSGHGTAVASPTIGDHQAGISFAGKF